MRRRWRAPRTARYCRTSRARPRPARRPPQALRPPAPRRRSSGSPLLTAAGWGLGPVLIDLAATAYGRATATMILESQMLGAVLLGVVILVRRSPLTATG